MSHPTRAEELIIHHLNDEAPTYIYIYIYAYECLKKTRLLFGHPSPIGKISKVATVVKGDPKAPFLISTTPRCKEGSCLFSLIAPFYP